MKRFDYHAALVVLLHQWKIAKDQHDALAKIIELHTLRNDTRERGYAEMLEAVITEVNDILQRADAGMES